MSRVASRFRASWPGWLMTGLVLAGALIWFFPIFWAVATSLQTETAIARKSLSLAPSSVTFDAYLDVLRHSNIALWYFNSAMIGLIATLVVLISSICCGYALSQLRFRGRGLLLSALVICVMVPVEALVINHFMLMNSLGFVNTWQGIILPQIIVPMAVIIFKQFFDLVPRDYREAAILDNAGHFRILWKIYVPMNWSIITAVGIATFITVWNNFMWPFLIATSEATMTIPVGITQVKDHFGITYARDMATAVLAGLPVALLYALFQKRITQAIMVSAGIKG